MDVADGAALQVELAIYDRATMTLQPVHDGDPADLVFPPQGGHVMFVGGRIRNGRETTVQLDGRLLSLDGATLYGQNARTVELLPAGEDTLIPDLRSYTNVSNIAVCPNNARIDFFGNSYLLELRVTELASRRSGTARNRVVLACRQKDAKAQALCQCQCAASYLFGKC